jgi:hypothetical protein
MERGMYEAATSPLESKHLNQGDFIRGMLRPRIVTDKTFCAIEGGNKLVREVAAALFKAVNFALGNKRLRLVAEVESTDALVVSNSCDNFGADSPVILAPVRLFKFRQQPPSWSEISIMATGTANPKLFYLPASPEFGIDRSEAHLSQMFVVSPEYINKCFEAASTTRLCGLKPEAVRRLQWQIAMVFGRNPREDYDWPSDADLELKRAYYEELVRRGGANHEDNKRELAIIRSALSRSASGSVPSNGSSPTNGSGTT